MNKPLLVLTAVVASSAFAQDAVTAPPPPPPPLPQEAAPPMDAPLADPGGRVRWGVSGNLGWHVPQSAFSFGAEGRVGYQFTNVFSLYATLGGTVALGFGGSVNAGGASVSAIGLTYWYLGAIAEAMFGDIFYVGGGPVFANGALGGGTASGNANGVGTVTYGHVGPMFGLDARLGLGLGRPKGPPSFRRGGFNIGIDALVLFRPNAAVVRTQADANGGSVDVATNELMVTVTPMLTLGYDAR